MPANFKKSTRRVVATALATPWMIEFGALNQIRAILEARSNGIVRTRDEIEALIGRPAGSKTTVIKAASLNFDPDDDDDEDGPIVVDGVALLPLTGVLAPRLSWMDELSGGTSTELFSGWFLEAMNDSRVSSILLHVDSPGGSAQGNEEVASLIRSMRGNKPVKCVATGMMASAAYYVGSSAERVFASPSSEVGSVGAYMIHGETSKQDAAEGVKYTVIKAGDNKAAGNSVEPLTDKSKATLQERIDAFYDQFVAAVAANMGVSVDTVESNFGQGKVMIAGAAKSAGLIHDVATFGDVLNEMRVKTPAAGGMSRPPKNARAEAHATEEKITEAKHVEPVGVPLADSNGQKPILQAQGGSTMIKAALLRKGLCSADATDAEVKAIIAGFCAAKGVAVPESEEAVCELIEPKPKAVDANQVRQAERLRAKDLRARGQLLNVSAAEIESAIDDGLDVRAALDKWTAEAAEREQPIPKTITAGGQEGDVFPKAVVDGLFARANPSAENRTKLSREAREAGRMRLLDVGRRMLVQSGARIDMHDEDQIAHELLAGAGRSGERQLAIRANTDGAGYNRPGDFPGILSALMGKMLDEAEELTEATCQDWTGVMPSVADFKPKTIHAIGEFGELPQHEDGEPFDESNNAEEASWIQVGEYADNWTLTPRMVIDDDLDALQDVAVAKQGAHDLTMERLCVNLLTGNAPAQDGYPLFDATDRLITTTGGNGNVNDILSGSGGVPSTTQLALMRKYLRKIYGLNQKQKLNQSLKHILIPEDLETVTEQLLVVGLGLGTGSQVGVITPTTETTVQIFRGRVTYTVVPMLAEASTLQWYGLSSSKRTAIVRTYLKGYEQMRATSWFDPNTGCRKWNFMGRMAAAIRTWRTIVRNAGQ